MPTPIMLAPGITHTALQNQVIALPGRTGTFISGAVCEFSLKQAGPWVAITPVTGTIGITAAGGGFVRCPGGICEMLFS
jgi:hypothetical protein